MEGRDSTDHAMATDMTYPYTYSPITHILHNIDTSNTHYDTMGLVQGNVGRKFCGKETETIREQRNIASNEGRAVKRTNW